MNAHTMIMMGRTAKRIFLKYRLHRLVEPFSEGILKLALLSKLSQWCANQGRPDWSDRNDPGYRDAKRYELYQHVVETEDLHRGIDYLEFGVGEGYSFDWWVEHNTDPSSHFTGFDTFTGLPEKWGYFKEGAYSANGKLPAKSDKRCSFETGLFQDTLDRFLEKFKGDRRTVVHMDADLYSSTLYVLTRIAPKLKPGDILFFDEFGVPTHEFRAFTDAVWAYRIRYKLLGAVNNYMKVAIKIL